MTSFSNSPDIESEQYEEVDAEEAIRSLIQSLQQCLNTLEISLIGFVNTEEDITLEQYNEALGTVEEFIDLSKSMKGLLKEFKPKPVRKTAKK